jgi:hypothetical protein
VHVAQPEAAQSATIQLKFHLLGRPRVDNIDATGLQILRVASRSTCAAGGRYPGNHRVELTNGSAGCSPLGADFRVGVNRIAVETQDSLREVFVEDCKSKILQYPAATAGGQQSNFMMNLTARNGGHEQVRTRLVFRLALDRRRSMRRNASGRQQRATLDSGKFVLH